MSKRIIVNGFYNERGYMLDYLRQKHGWDPVFFMGRKQERQWVEANYSNTIFVDAMELRLSHFDYSPLGPVVPIDRAIIRTLSRYEHSCFGLMEDATGWDFSEAERRRFYYDMLRYWNTVIHRLKPDIFVSWALPHNTPDYTLYLLCKHVYHIPTVFTDSIPYMENYSACHDEVEDLSSAFKDVYHSTQKLELSPETKEYLNNIRTQNLNDPKFITIDNINKKYSYGRAIAQLIKRIPFMFKKQQVAVKHNRHPFGSPKTEMSVFQYDLWQFLIMLKNKAIYKLYASYAKEPDLNKKYVLFAANYQPEGTTCPLAETYDDLLLILDLLSASVPKDWVIYYKEYPQRLMQTYYKFCLARNKSYYERIASLKNVQMIPSEMNTTELIKNSQAVATATSTVGWEAAVKGKPVLIFGSVWYGGCKSIFRIETYQDCLAAMDKIKNGYKPDQADVDRYAAAIEKSSHPLFVHRDFDQRIKDCPDQKHEMERIAKAFYEAYERYYISK